MNKYVIQVAPAGGDKVLVSVLKEIGYDQREGAAYETLAVTLGYVEEDAILDAVNEAFS